MQGPNVVRNQLLRQTLDYALANVPFYQDLSRKHPSKQQWNLADFPIVDSHLMTEFFAQFVVMKRFPDFVLPTGGTTTGVPTLTFRNLEEYEYRAQFLFGLNPGDHIPLEQVSTIGIVLNTRGDVAE